jgi:hypothetical protein
LWKRGNIVKKGKRRDTRDFALVVLRIAAKPLPERVSNSGTAAGL